MIIFDKVSITLTDRYKLVKIKVEKVFKDTLFMTLFLIIYYAKYPQAFSN